MRIDQVSCPACSATLRPRTPVAVGTRIRCPKCTTVFTVTPPAVQADDELDFDATPRPRRVRRSKGGAGAALSTIAIILAIVVPVSGVVGAYALWGPKPKADLPKIAPMVAKAKTPAPRPAGQPSSDGFPIGQMAPDILGEDIDGTPFKLSDYRGKVVVLDFWGHW